jgi:hypothetical protein
MIDTKITANPQHIWLIRSEGFCVRWKPSMSNNAYIQHNFLHIPSFQWTLKAKYVQ